MLVAALPRRHCTGDSCLGDNMHDTLSNTVRQLGIAQAMINARICSAYEQIVYL